MALWETYYARNTSTADGYDLSTSTGNTLTHHEEIWASGAAWEARIGNGTWTFVSTSTQGMVHTPTTTVRSGTASSRYLEFRYNGGSPIRFSLPTNRVFAVDTDYEVHSQIACNFDEGLGEWVTSLGWGTALNAQISIYNALVITPSGPWNYDLFFPSFIAEASQVASFDAVLGAKVPQLSADFSQDSVFNVTTTSNNSFGPWDYDLDFPSIGHVLVFDQEASLEAILDPFQTIATGLDPTSSLEDDTVVNGVSYRYQLVDSLGNVMTSNDITMEASTTAEFAQEVENVVDVLKGHSVVAQFDQIASVQIFGYISSGRSAQVAHQLESLIEASILKTMVFVDAAFDQVADATSSQVPTSLKTVSAVFSQPNDMAVTVKKMFRLDTSTTMDSRFSAIIISMSSGTQLVWFYNGVAGTEAMWGASPVDRWVLR